MPPCKWELVVVAAVSTAHNATELLPCLCVCREAQSLLATARGLGLGVQDVEMELILMEGNWAAAAETLEARVLGGAAAQVSNTQHGGELSCVVWGRDPGGARAGRRSGAGQ